MINMYTRSLRYVSCQDLTPIVLFFFILLPACTSTYPHNIVEKSITDICREEFNIEVKTVITGLTVHTFIELDNLLLNISVLKEDLITNLSHVMSAVSRVVLSSDGSFQFIVLHAVDSKKHGTYITMIRFVDDIRRLLTGDISHNEYFNRLVIHSGIDKRASAEYSVYTLLSDKTIPGQIFNMKPDHTYTVEDIRSKKMNTKTYFIYCLIQDRFKPTILENPHNLEIVEYSEYVFTVKTDPDISVVDSITLQTLGKNIRTWDRIMPFEDIKLPDFLAEQLSKRIHTALTNDPRWSKEYITYSVSGEFIHLPEGKDSKKTPHKPEHLPQWIAQNKIYIFFKIIINRVIASGKSIIRSSDTKYRTGPYGFFKINIDAQARILYLIQKQIQPQIGVKKSDLLDEINDTIIQKVLNRYGYYHYKEVQLINTNTGKTLIKP